MPKNKLKFGFPLGTFCEEMLELFRATGYEVTLSKDPTGEIGKITLDDPEIELILMRPIPMASFVEKGLLDAGISTQASVLETKAKVKQICSNLEIMRPIFGKTRLVIAVPKESPIKSIKNLEGKKIITRVPNLTQEFLKKNKISAKIIYSDAPLNEPMTGVVGEAIVEFAQTGSHLIAYNLRILENLLESSVVLIANERALEDKWKREKIEDLAILLKGARLAQEYSGLMLHASNEMMAEVLKILPVLKKPTVTQLRGENWFDVLAVARKKELKEIIPKLKKIGCTDIVEFPLNKVVL